MDFNMGGVILGQHFQPNPIVSSMSKTNTIRYSYSFQNHYLSQHWKEIQKIDDSWFTTIYKNVFWVSSPKVSKLYVKHFIITISISKFGPTCCVVLLMLNKEVWWSTVGTSPNVQSCSVKNFKQIVFTSSFYWVLCVKCSEIASDTDSNYSIYFHLFQENARK